MRKEKILNLKVKILTEDQRKEYFEDGGVKVDNVLSKEWLEKSKKAIKDFIEQSRNFKESNSIFDLQKNHSKENPKLRRVSSPCDHNSDLWDLLVKGPIGDVAEDI